MNWYENINISFSYEPILLLVGFIIILGYTLFIYRTTLPPINRLAKGVLIFLRTLALLLLLFLIFDPILRLTYSTKIEPENLIFIDNSKSIAEFTSSSDLEKLSELIEEWNNELYGNAKFFTFGSSIGEIRNIESDEIDFDAPSTQFNSVIQQIKKSNNAASVILVSDGINNEGINPEYQLNNISVPIYTVGIGDSSSFADLKIDQIRSNEFIYADHETELEIILKNEDLSDKTATVQIFEDQTLIQTKKVKLSPSGINRVRFPFNSSEEGEHKLTVKTSTDLEEKNKSNNEKSTVINILATKKKIAVIAGTPSTDLSIIVNSIKQNEDFEVEQIVELQKGVYYNKLRDLSIVKESDIIFLVGFPSSNSNENYLSEIESIILSTSKPIFFSFTNSIDFNKLKYLQRILPFQFNSISEKFNEVQVQTNSTLSGLLGSSENIRDRWNNLPPINLTQTNIVASVSSEVLLNDQKNIDRPIIFTDNTNRKSIVVTASNIWRWKLKTPNKENKLFDNFILNSVKWLAISPKSQYFNVKLNKKNYRLGESITFNANLYDDTYEPINNENIVLEIMDNSRSQQYNFSSIGNGLYEAIINLNKPGIYNYTAKIQNSAKNFAPIKGSINVEPIELELVEGKLNKRFLASISLITGGKYSGINKTEYLINELNSNYQNKIYLNKTDKELRLSSFELILMIIVLLFSIEWISRKFLRMI